MPSPMTTSGLPGSMTTVLRAELRAASDLRRGMGAFFRNTAFFRAATCVGVVPQQPPRIAAPAPTRAPARRANSASSMS